MGSISVIKSKPLWCMEFTCKVSVLVWKFSTSHGGKKGDEKSISEVSKIGSWPSSSEYNKSWKIEISWNQ